MKEYSNLFGIDITKKTRKTEYATARFAVFYKLRIQGYNLAIIGRMLGCGHSNVCHGVKKFSDLLETKDPLAVNYWEKIKDK